MILNGLLAGGILGGGILNGIIFFPPPPSGFAYLTDNDGALLRDNNGNYLIARI